MAQAKAMKQAMKQAKKSYEAKAVEEEADPSIFTRLFGETGSHASSYYDSDDDEESFSSEASDNDETDAGYVELARFDRDLRAKHRGACKNMTSGKYSKAIKAFEGILSDLLDRYGESHHRVGAALHNVAVANLRGGLLGDAKDAIEEAVRIRKLTLGVQSSKLADSFVEYGIILLSLKKYTESLKIFKEAFRLREREVHLALKSENAQEAQLKMAKIKHNIGCVNFELGNLEEAKASYIEAIDQQRTAFGTWSTPFMIMTDTTKPGFLTMASTMCNKGYIDLEQENFADAISVFYESLKIQKLLLEADNKLILGTLENIGFAYCRRGEYDKALKIYKELCTLQQESYSEVSQKGWSQCLRKLIYCQVTLEEWEDSMKSLELLVDYLTTKGSKAKNGAKDRENIYEIMGEVNYQIFKFPSLAETANRAMGCGICSQGREDIDLSALVPKKPANGSKMSGHRMTYA